MSVRRWKAARARRRPRHTHRARGSSTSPPTTCAWTTRRRRPPASPGRPSSARTLPTTLVAAGSSARSSRGMRAPGRRCGKRRSVTPSGAAPSSPRAMSHSTERWTAGSRRRTRRPARSCGSSRSDREWWATRLPTRDRTASSTWRCTPGSAATGSCWRGTSGRMTRRMYGRRRTSCRTSPGTPAREASCGSSPCSRPAARDRGVPRTRSRATFRGCATGSARLGGRRGAAGGRPAGGQESIQRRPAVGGGGRADVRRDELRRLSRRRGRGLGGPQPARRPLALRGLRRGDLPVDLLRPAARHAGVRWPAATRCDLETRHLSPVARATRRRADADVEVAMRWLGGLAGAVLLALVLWDAFETIILPRRVSGRIRLTRLFYRSTWIPWRATARALSGRRRDVFLSIFGPLSLILLLALWAVGSVLSFGLLQWAAGSAMKVVGDGGGAAPGFWSDVYMSGTTFFTLGLGDVVPRTALAKTLTVIEAGTGFAFLAAVIGYFPVIYQAFSRREVAISLLDARAGSPPSASELLWRHRGDPGTAALTDLLRDWERWAADVLESHLSYPPLAYFRSQHYNESWLAALTTILDASAVVMIGHEGWCARQAELTFAMARHAVVDLAQVFSTPPERAQERLSSEQLARLRERLAAGGVGLRDWSVYDTALTELRRMYEPYVAALAHYLAVPLPPWVREVERPDNWQTSAWDRVVKLPARGRAAEEDHF